jgi:hypothetical protein
MALVKTSSGWKMQDSTIATRDKLNELNGVSVVPSTRNVWAVGVGTNAAAG